MFALNTTGGSVVPSVGVGDEAGACVEQCSKVATTCLIGPATGAYHSLMTCQPHIYIRTAPARIRHKQLKHKCLRLAKFLGPTS